MKNKIAIYGNRVLTRPLKILNKSEKKVTSIITPTDKDHSKTPRHLYDDHKYQAEIIKVGLKYRLRNLLIPKAHKLTKGKVVYFIGGDGFPVIQDDIDYLILETKRIIGTNQKGNQGYKYLNFKDV